MFIYLLKTVINHGYVFYVFSFTITNQAGFSRFIMGEAEWFMGLQDSAAFMKEIPFSSKQTSWNKVFHSVMS